MGIPELGIIMLRHVKRPEANRLWNHNYRMIRKNYPDTPLLIIDDHSDKSVVKEEQPLENVEIVESRFSNPVAELLPYIYLYEKKPFRKAIIVHDAAFIQQKLDTDRVVDVQILFYFDPHLYKYKTDVSLLLQLNHSDDLLSLYAHNEFVGCFGCMAIVSLEFVEYLMEKYNLMGLTDHIIGRSERSSLERVMGILFTRESKSPLPAYQGFIGNHPGNWNLDFFNHYMDNLDHYKNFPIFKIWNGR